jgi:hypothetical protein
VGSKRHSRNKLMRAAAAAFHKEALKNQAGGALCLWYGEMYTQDSTPLAQNCATPHSTLTPQQSNTTTRHHVAKVSAVSVCCGRHTATASAGILKHTTACAHMLLHLTTNQTRARTACTRSLGNPRGKQGGVNSPEGGGANSPGGGVHKSVPAGGHEQLLAVQLQHSSRCSALTLRKHTRATLADPPQTGLNAERLQERPRPTHGHAAAVVAKQVPQAGRWEG